MRPNRQSSNAGFPTKFAESLSVGTPVITNLTSDIELYLKNETNGFRVDDDLEISLINIFHKITQLNDVKYTEMRKASRLTAEIEFDYQNYKESVSNLFNSRGYTDEIEKYN